MTIEEAIQEKIGEGFALLNNILVEQVRALYVASEPMAGNPRVEAVVADEVERLQRLHDELMLLVESAILRANNKLN